VSDSPRESVPVLELEGLVVRYGRFTALQGLDARFQGGSLGLLGPNGAGKSSLLRAILGLIRPARGSIRVLGRDLRRGGAALRRRVGYMPERDSWIGGVSGVAGLAHLAEISGLRRDDAMIRAHDVLHFTGLAEERYRPVATYSVGMRQRYKLAAALVHDPDVLFLDEPTNGMDPRGRVRMLELVDRVRREHGIHLIVASHLLPDVERLCDEVWVLDAGRLRMADTLERLTAEARGAKRVRLPAAAAARALAEAAGREGFEVQEGERAAEVILSRPDREVEAREVFRLARRLGLEVHGLKPAARSLEQAFVEVLEGDG